MADCYYHGYTGGPGACGACEEERRQRLPPGTLDGYGLRQEDAEIGSLGRQRAAQELARQAQQKERSHVPEP